MIDWLAGKVRSRPTFGGGGCWQSCESQLMPKRIWQHSCQKFKIFYLSLEALEASWRKESEKQVRL